MPSRFSTIALFSLLKPTFFLIISNAVGFASFRTADSTSGTSSRYLIPLMPHPESRSQITHVSDDISLATFRQATEISLLNFISGLKKTGSFLVILPS